jgi:hypothetical protein
MDFTKIRFDDSSVKNIRIFDDAVEVDYLDWQEKQITLRFEDAISCFSLSPHGKALSHGTIETSGSYLHECCEIAEENRIEGFVVFNFVAVWTDRRILRIVARSVAIVS